MHVRQVALSVVLAMTAAVPGAASAATPRFRMALAPGDQAPRVRLPLLSGEDVRHDWSKHPLTVVNFWATWCNPCRQEMPALQDLYARHRDEGLSVLGILLDFKAQDADAQRFLAEQRVEYTILRGSIRAIEEWGGVGIFPTTFLVDRQGRIVRRYVGATAEQIRGLVRDVENVLRGQPLGSMVLPEPGEEEEAAEQP